MKTSNFKKNTFGFTLPELLIVMTVLAGLAAVMMVSYPASQRRARDTRRISDLKQYQTAIELYANRVGSYSGLTSGVPGNGAQCGLLGLSTCPRDPKSPAQNYSLQANISSYSLSVRLEQQTGTTPNYFVVCSDGRSGYCATAPSGPTCGSCP